MFPDKAIEALAHERASVCGKCEHAVKGMIAVMIEDEIEDIEGLVCGLCNCPLSGKIRSVESKCEDGKWKH